MLLRPIFCEKLKIAPHRKTAPPQTFEFPNLAEKSVSISVKTSFFVWRPPDLGGRNLRISDFGRKISLNFGKDLFFLETTWFWAEETFEFRISAEKSVSISAKTFFFLFFFWRLPDFGRKKPLNFGFRPKNQSQFRRRPFFFWRPPDFGRKKPLNIGFRPKNQS